MGTVFGDTDQSAAVEFWAGAFGMIRVSDIALAAGAASIPGPVTEQSDDGWFVWQGYSGSGEGFAANEPGRQGFHFPFDSKAARRVEEGFGVALMAENASATTGQQVSVIVSMLTVVNT